MNNYRLAEAAVRSRREAAGPQRPVEHASGTPADPIYDQPGPLTSRTRYLLALHQVARKGPIVVLDEAANVERIRALR